MNQFFFKQLQIKFRNNSRLNIYEEYDSNITLHKINVDDFKEIYATEEFGNIFYKPNIDNSFLPLRLKETYQYVFELQAQDLTLELSPELKAKAVGKNTWSFKVINYLGKSHIKIRDNSGNVVEKVEFEIVPVKINYEEDYVTLTEEIADYCSELLMDYASPTSLNFTIDDTQLAKTPLEQFIFLRQFCNSENLEYLFSSIKNNPDRILVSEDDLKPYGVAPISQSFYSKPFSNSANWFYSETHEYIPELISSTRKYESYDTPANRFIKFALNTFLDICDSVINRIQNTSLSYYSEAQILKQNIEILLEDSFFEDVLELSSLPINNQVLQKREGYHQIFNAFNMLDLAMQLNWKGKDIAYEGQARNIALLYEYWLVFKLMEVLRELGATFQVDQLTKKNSLIQLSDDDSLIISLKEGAKSLISYDIKNYNLKLNFYYNRTFTSNQFRGTQYEGSYSRDFRPDYTLAIFPNWYSDESTAVLNGEVSYIHFDAKYRVTDLTDIFGLNNSTTEEINRDKQLENINTYKRGDLLKMHTYNDAIRRTIGSYVLYPGTNKNSTQYNVYDEILPGVGAFAIRPGDKENGKSSILEFIKNILIFKTKQSSRLYRKDYFENIVIQSPTEKYYDKTEKTNSPYRIHHSGNQLIQSTLSDYSSNSNAKNICMIGFLRMDYLRKIQDSLPIDINTNKEKSIISNTPVYFYYYAVKDGYVYPQHKNIGKATKFYGWCKQYVSESSRKTIMLNFEADIINSELVSNEVLSSKISGNHKAEFYYLITLGNIKYKDVKDIEDLEKSNGNMAISPYSPKIIEM